MIHKNDKNSGYSTKYYNTLSKQIWIKASAVLIIFPNIEKFGMQSKARPSISPNLFWTVQIFLDSPYLLGMTKTFWISVKKHLVINSLLYLVQIRPNQIILILAPIYFKPKD